MSTENANEAPVQSRCSAARRIPPDPDCLLCHGTGEYAGGLICQCSIVCECGEKRPNNYQGCENPGCNNHGCDACSEVEWCGDEHDDANGDYFCSECRD